MKILYSATVILCFLFASQDARSQTIENVRNSFDGDKVVITYDLIYPDPAQKFVIRVFSSHDNYARPLSLLIGDFGDKVVAGKSNRIIWDAKSSLPADFDGDIIIKIGATKVVAAVKLSMKPFDQITYKRGRTIEIKWVGGNPDDKLNLTLFKESMIMQKIADNINNDDHYSWTMPKSVKSGKSYFIRLSNAKDPLDLSNSQLFNIKPRTPSIVKVLPFLAAGAAIIIINGGSKDSGTKATSTSTALPKPTDPT